MPPSNVVEIILALQNLRQFVSGTKTASDAVEGVGTAAEKTGKQAKVSWKSIAKWGGAATLVYGAQKFIRGAVEDTTDLAKSTLMLNRTTGMGVRGASAWVAVAKTRGIETKQLNMSFVRLSKAMQSAEGGSKSATKMFTQVGIPLKALRRMNTDQVVYRISDAFKNMRDPARRAALTQQFFGRSGQQLLPMLAGGSKALREQQGMAAKYGLTLKGKTLAQVKEMIAHERELKMAWAGAKLQLGTALLPILVQVGQVLVSLARIIAPLTKNTTLLKIAIGALAIAFIAYKVAVIAARIATLELNATLLASPWFWVAVAIAAVIIGFIVLYKKCKLFRDIVNAMWHVVQATWKWIKDHWKLLLLVFGPTGIAILLIIKHFNTLKRVATAVINGIKRAFNALKPVAVAVFQAIARAVQPVVDAIRTLVDLAKRAVNWLGKVHVPGGGLLKKLSPFQHGGSVTSRTFGIVGERGPEMVSLPGGATVAPLTQQQTLAAVGGGGGGAPIVVQVVLDRKVLAQAVARDTSDRIARK